jgi:ABC-2 type transport system ATP-binding protein
MIEAQSLSRYYGKTAAVEDVTFSIGDNEVVGLLGHNGAGKTTIMRMLCGYLEPSAGTINIDGADIASTPHSIQKRLGYLPENPPVYPQMMVAEYLDYAATLKGIERSVRLTAIQKALLDTDLSRHALDPISNLSRGFKQRVGVAQAILGQPQLLILDEPTNGLDPNQTRHMRQLIKRLAREATVILSTHILQEVDAVCDRVLMLRNGRLALDQSLSDLHDSKTLVLRTCTSGDSLTVALQHLPQVASLEESLIESELLHYELRLNPEFSMNTATHEIAQCVIKTGAKLYQLEALSRDLDSVFREVYGNDD